MARQLCIKRLIKQIKHFLKTGKDGAEMTPTGKSFHERGVAILKAWSPAVVSRNRRTVSLLSRYYNNCDLTTIRRYHNAFDYDGSDRNYDMRSIRLRCDYDPTTTYRAPASIRREQKMLDAKNSPLALLAQTCSSIGKDPKPPLATNMSIFVVVVS